MTTITTPPITVPDSAARPRLPAALAALVVAAPLTDALASALHPAMPDDPHDLLEVVGSTPRWYAMTLVALLAAGLLAYAYVALARLVRVRSPRLATVALVVGTAGIVLMSAMQGFKLFLPTLAEVGATGGPTAVGAFVESADFAPMIAAFVCRAIAWLVLAVALVKTKIAPVWVGVFIGLGVVAAFALPAGPDAAGWVAVATGCAFALRRTPD